MSDQRWRRLVLREQTFESVSTCPQIPYSSGSRVQANPTNDRSLLKRLLLILFLALALRVTYVAAVTRHDHHLYDPFWYTIGADLFGQGKGPVAPVLTLPRRPSAEHPPLTSIILAPVARLTHGDETAMRLTMACLGCVVVLDVGLIAREIAGNRAALIAAGLASITTVSLAATPILLYGAPRYKVPAMPLITLIAAAGAVTIVDRFRARRPQSRRARRATAHRTAPR